MQREELQQRSMYVSDTADTSSSRVSSNSVTSYSILRSVQKRAQRQIQIHSVELSDAVICLSCELVAAGALSLVCQTGEISIRYVSVSAPTSWGHFVRALLENVFNSEFGHQQLRQTSGNSTAQEKILVQIKAKQTL
jgi:hypothetical protein